MYVSGVCAPSAARAGVAPPEADSESEGADPGLSHSEWVGAVGTALRGISQTHWVLSV